jgi:REP-associated tyrosine transposase
MIFHHPFNIQFFDGNRVELSDDVERRLVMKIRASALNLLMLLRQQFDRLPSPITSLIGTARDATLGGLQFLFRCPVGLRILDCLTGREHGEVLNPDINPNRFAGLRNEPALVLLDDKNDIPAVSFALDRAGLDRSFDWTGETDAARSDFRQVKLVALKPESALWIGEGIETRGRLESRIPRCFSILHPTKESLEGLIHTAKGILKNLAVNGAYVLTDFFNRWQLYSLSVIVDRKSVDLIGVAPFLQRRIVKLAANIQCARAGGYKLGIGPELVFVRYHVLHYTLVHMATQQLQALHHCVYSLHFHLVLVTKYRRKAIKKDMLERLDTIFQETLEKWRSELIEFNGEEDHIHLLFKTNPTVQLSKLVNNLKTVSSRLIRRDFRQHVNRIYRKPVFWHRSYCLISTGGATIEILRKYIEEQGREE